MPVMSHDDSLKVIEGVNNVIKNSGINTNKISDGYHSFEELYSHRFALYMALCRNIQISGGGLVWRSKIHSDGSSYNGWFLLGIGVIPGTQLSYHLPMSKWDECDFATIFEKAPEWDGHTSNDVLERLKLL